MKATEIRIGNYIASGKIFKDTSIIGKVLEIGNQESVFEQIYIETSESFEWLFKDEYCGIPLSKEILEKCGFRYEDFIISGYIDGNHCIYEYTNNEWGFNIFCMKDEKNGYPLTVTIKYLHELQNLYFSLHKKELKIKLWN